jgi:hypothetical protein
MDPELDAKSLELAKNTHSSIRKSPSVTQAKDKDDDFFTAL